MRIIPALALAIFLFGVLLVVLYHVSHFEDDSAKFDIGFSAVMAFAFYRALRSKTQ